MLARLKTIYQSFCSTDPVVRHAARHTLLAYVARKWGMRLYNRNLHWLDDDDVYCMWKEFDGEAKYISDRKYVMYSLACSLAHLPGDTVECGVFDGGSSYLICKANARFGESKRHLVFDSFEGLSDPESIDEPTDPNAYQWQKHDLSVSQETVQKNLGQFESVEYFKGWIPDRFDDVAERRFSLVHIDVDLYQPTLDSLKFFYPRLVPGRVILCDDYGSTVCPGAFKACNEFAESIGVPCLSIPTGQGMIWKR